MTSSVGARASRRWRRPRLKSSCTPRKMSSSPMTLVLALLVSATTASLVITEVADKGDPSSAVQCGMADYIEL